MNEESKVENTQPTNTQPEDNGTSEKKFTQADVDRIIKARLENRKRIISEETAAQTEAQEQKFAQREAELSERESRLSCREYLMENGYPAELLNVIDTRDADDFKAKALTAVEALRNTVNRQQPGVSHDPVYSQDGLSGTPFDRSVKHTPKKY